MLKCPHCGKVYNENQAIFSGLSPDERETFFRIWLSEFSQQNVKVSHLISSSTFRRFLAPYLVHSDSERGHQTILGRMLKDLSSQEISVDGFSLGIFISPYPRTYRMIPTSSWGVTPTPQEKMERLHKEFQERQEIRKSKLEQLVKEKEQE